MTQSRTHPGPPPPDPEAGTVAGPGLTVNQILAGAGAAATSAVAGSFFGAAGTVVGAALGSVVSTVGTTLYQRSLDRTRDTVRARIRVVGKGRSTVVVERPVASGGSTGAAVPAPRTSPEEPETVLLAPVAPVRARPRRWLVAAGVTVLVFVLGLLLVTGLEWAKGSPLGGGEAGTSVGEVVGPPPVPVDDGLVVSPPDGTPEQDGSATPTAEPDAPDGQAPGTGGSEPGSGPAADPGSEGTEPETGPGDAGAEGGSPGGGASGDAPPNG